MDSFELNKLIGAFLGVVFVVFSVSIASDAIFASHAPETPGYAIEVPDEPAAGGAPADAGPSALDLLATADPAAGESTFRRCASCHTVEQGGANRVGPNLWGVVGRVVASHEGFSYSGAMTTYSEGGTKQWEFENISHFLVNPRSYVSGTTMAFAGIRDPQEEANLIAYLNQQSDSPLPLPEPAAAEEPAGDEAAGDEAPAENGEAAPAEGEAAPAENGEAAPAEGAAPAENGDAAAPAGEEAAPAAEDAAPATNGDEAAPADTDATETDEGPATEAAPAEPTADQDGTEASPETDAGQPAADGETTDEEPRAPAQN
ncbi:c-type cytochrome [Aliihoeflea sp. PC F10.4]